MREFVDVDLIRVRNSKWTFGDENVKVEVQGIITKELPIDNSGESKLKIINFFAGQTDLEVGAIRIDANHDMPNLDIVGDTCEIIYNPKYNLEDIDIGIYDPPWNERKSKEKYENEKTGKLTYVGKYTRHKDQLASLIKKGGIMISAGYYTREFFKVRGFVLEKLIVCENTGEIRPYFISVERKIR